MAAKRVAWVGGRAIPKPRMPGMKLQDALECDCCDCYCQKLQCHDYNVPNFSQAAWPQQLKSFLRISRVGIVCFIMMTGWLVAMSCSKMMQVDVSNMMPCDALWQSRSAMLSQYSSLGFDTEPLSGRLFVRWQLALQLLKEYPDGTLKATPIRWYGMYSAIEISAEIEYNLHVFWLTPFATAQRHLRMRLLNLSLNRESFNAAISSCEKVQLERVRSKASAPGASWSLNLNDPGSPVSSHIMQVIWVRASSKFTYRHAVVLTVHALKWYTAGRWAKESIPTPTLDARAAWWSAFSCIFCSPGFPIVSHFQI